MQIVAALLAVGPAAAQIEALLAGLAVDDECSFNGIAGSEACSLAALQLRARTSASASADHASAGASSPILSSPMDPLSSTVPARTSATDQPRTSAAAVTSHKSSLVPVSPVASSFVSSPTHLGDLWYHKMLKSWKQVGQLSRVAVYFTFITLVGLLLAVAYDIAARWLYTRRFRMCIQDLHRVQEVLLKGDDESPLCPYCIEYIKCTAAQSKVAFICGHCFHLDCVNKCFDEHPGRAGQCPLCSCAYLQAKIPHDHQSIGGEQDVAEADKASMASDTVEACMQDVRRFVLASMCRKYPELISEARAKRWLSCHVEVWLSELQCPKYASVFAGHAQQGK